MSWKKKTLEGSIRLHAHLIKSTSSPTIFHCNKLIEAYSTSGLLQEARLLFDEMSVRNVFTWNAMIHGCIKHHDLDEALHLFHSSPEKDAVTYNSMISGYARESCEPQAIEVFTEMRRNGVGSDEFTLTLMLNVSAKLCDLWFGRELHACFVKLAVDSDSFGTSSLIDMYSKCGHYSEASHIFSDANEMDLVSKNAMVAACCRVGRMDMAFDLFWDAKALADTVLWNTLISGCVKNDSGDMALQLFVQMAWNGIRRNGHTFASVLGACSSTKRLKHGKQVHSWVIKSGLCLNPFISSGLVDFYCKCDELRYAEAVHSQFGMDNIFSTASMIVGLSQRGNMEEARRLFDALADKKNSVVWTALLSGYLKSQQTDEVLKLFREYRRTKESIYFSDTSVLLIVLGACTVQADVDHGKQVHTQLIRMGMKMDEKLDSALVDMYAKCGEIRHAAEIFRPILNKDRVLYNAMMNGFAHHGRARETIQLFEELLQKRIRPDSVTFIALLSACRHGKLVETGENYFNSMTEEYGISPEIDHYSCMIDMFGRANQLDKAMSLVRSIPFEPDAILWGTLLNACRMNGNTTLAKETEERLMRIEAGNGARYVQLANAYAAGGEWGEVERIRRKMRRGEVKKLPGCSWVHVKKKVRTFTSGDKHLEEAKAIYSILESLSSEMEVEHGFIMG